MSLKKIFVITVFLGIFAFCISPANAMTTSELKTKINEIIAQIALLQQQLQQLQQPQQPQQSQLIGGGGCYNFNANLRLGDARKDVTALQNYLKSIGFSIGADIIGTFSNGTSLAVTAFQEKYASEILTPAKLTKGNGFVGQLTRAKLNWLYGCSTTNTATAPTNIVESQTTTNTTPQCQTLWWRDNSATTCQQKQFCGTYMYLGLQTFDTEAGCRASLPIQKPITSDTSTCVQKDGWCCIGNSCKSASPSCTVGVTPVFSNCDSNCSPIWNCSGSAINIPTVVTNLPPVVDSVSGPTWTENALTIIFAIKAHDPENGTLNYKVDWGDGIFNQEAVPAVSQTETQSPAHTYSNPGTYVIAVTITDDHQNTIGSSATVTADLQGGSGGGLHVFSAGVPKK